MQFFSSDTMLLVSDLLLRDMYSTLLVILALGTPFIVSYATTTIIANRALGLTAKCRPPQAPYWIPILGHALTFFRDTSSVARLTQVFNRGVVCVRLFTTRIYFVTGSENVMNIWRSKDLDATAVTSFSLKTFFNTPEESMKVYTGDMSGIGPQPHRGSKLAPKDRYYFQNRKHIVGFFNGNGLKNFASRFLGLLTKKIALLDIGTDWVEHEDFYTFVKTMLTDPAIEAMCGPILVERNPDFAEDFWKLDSDILYFFKGYPRWCIPGAFKNRAKLLQNTKDWHIIARENYDESCIEADGHDRFYGSPLMRSRQEYLGKIDSLDADAIASQDLGLLWAENANSIPAVFWMAYEALQRPQLLAEVQDQIRTSQSQSEPAPTRHPLTNIDALCNIPILQSMFAETLRLYTSLFALRSAPHGDFSICDLKIPKNELIGVDSRVAAMDTRIWTPGASVPADDPRAVDRFWPERFLGYPDGAGGLRFNTTRPTATASATNPSSPPANLPAGPVFSLDGLSGAWLPFGGGSRVCPGRSFAKQEIMIGFATLFSVLEIELLGEAGPVGPDLKYYGLGTLPPKGKVPFRVRRRG